jgi:hypothetical protein
MCCCFTGIGDKGLKIKSKRSSYVYTLPTQVTRRNQPSVATIKQDTFSQDWSKEQEAVACKEQVRCLFSFWHFSSRKGKGLRSEFHAYAYSAIFFSPITVK